jgi:hypothetical protein
MIKKLTSIIFLFSLFFATNASASQNILDKYLEKAKDTIFTSFLTAHAKESVKAMMPGLVLSTASGIATQLIYPFSTGPWRMFDPVHPTIATIVSTLTLLMTWYNLEKQGHEGLLTLLTAFLAGAYFYCTAADVTAYVRHTFLIWYKKYKNRNALASQPQQQETPPSLTKFLLLS